MNWLRRGRRRWLMGAGVMVVVAGAAALLLLYQANASDRALAAARERWQGRVFGDYHLLLVHETGHATCEQEVVASDERTGTSLRNDCGQPATWTVTRLFNWISELERASTRCYPGPAFCACQGTATTLVTYDQDLGYPREIIYEWRKRPNLVNLAYWQSLMDKSFPGCDKDGQGGPVVVKVTLSPDPRT